MSEVGFEVYRDSLSTFPMLDVESESRAFNTDDALNALNLIRVMSTSPTLRANPAKSPFPPRSEGQSTEQYLDVLSRKYTVLIQKIAEVLDLKTSDEVPGLKKARTRLEKITNKRALIKASRGEASPELERVTALTEQMEGFYSDVRALKITYGSYSLARSITEKLKQDALGATDALWSMFACRHADFGLVDKFPNATYEALSPDAKDLADSLLHIQTLFYGIDYSLPIEPLPLEYYRALSLLSKEQMKLVSKHLGVELEEVTPTGTHYAVPAIYSLILSFNLWGYYGKTSAEPLAQLGDNLKQSKSLYTALDALSLPDSGGEYILGARALCDNFQANSYLLEELFVSLRVLSKEQPLQESWLAEIEDLFKRLSITETQPKALLNKVFLLTQINKTLSHKNKNRLNTFVSDGRWANALKQFTNYRPLKDYFNVELVLEDYILADVSKKTTYYTWCAELCNIWFQITKSSPPKYNPSEGANPLSWLALRKEKAELFENTSRISKFIDDLWKAPKTNKKRIDDWRAVLEWLNWGTRAKMTAVITHALTLLSDNQDREMLTFVLGTPAYFTYNDPFTICFMCAITKRYAFDSEKEYVDGDYLNVREPKIKSLAFAEEKFLQTPQNLEKHNIKFYRSVPFNPLSLFMGNKSISGCCVRPWNFGTTCGVETYLDVSGQGEYTCNVVVYLEKAPQRQGEKLRNGFFGVFCCYGLTVNPNNRDAQKVERFLEDEVKWKDIRSDLLSSLGFTEESDTLSISYLLEKPTLFMQDPALISSFYTKPDNLWKKSPVRIFDILEYSESNKQLVVPFNSQLSKDIIRHYFTNCESVRDSAVFNTNINNSVFDEMKKNKVWVSHPANMSSTYEKFKTMYVDNQNLSALSATSLGVLPVLNASHIFRDLALEVSMGGCVLEYDGGKYSTHVELSKLRMLFSWPLFHGFIPTKGEVTFNIYEQKAVASALDIQSPLDQFVEEDLMYPEYFKASGGIKVYGDDFKKVVSKVTYAEMKKQRTPAKLNINLH